MIVNPFRFISSASGNERRALLASTLGWMLDGMDVTLYSMVVAELLVELHLSPGEAGSLASVTLIASALGGMLFGILADRIGRRSAMIASILVYSVFTAACGLSRGLMELVTFRFLLGLGMGGEWATGAALVAESWRAEHRGKALGAMQSGFAIGYALAAVIAAIVLPRWGWRVVFFAGVLPAFVTLWIQRGVQESPVWLAERPTAAPASRVFVGLFRAPFRRLVIVTLLMNSAALFAWWGLFTWIPPFLAMPSEQGGRGLAIATSSAFIVVMQAGMWLGYASFGFISDTLGQKKTYMGYLLAAAVLVPLYARAESPTSLIAFGPLVAFFGTGHFTGFGIITAELFPTSIRGTAMGLTYNFGRALSAAAPWAIGALAERSSLASAFWLSAFAFLAAGLLATALPANPSRRLE
jgi:MFS family permease